MERFDGSGILVRGPSHRNRLERNSVFRQARSMASP
jgi:hypothetical protein